MPLALVPLLRVPFPSHVLGWLENYLACQQGILVSGRALNISLSHTLIPSLVLGKSVAFLGFNFLIVKGGNGLGGSPKS